MLLLQTSAVQLSGKPWTALHLRRTLWPGKRGPLRPLRGAPQGCFARARFRVGSAPAATVADHMTGGAEYPGFRFPECHEVPERSVVESTECSEARGRRGRKPNPKPTVVVTVVRVVVEASGAARIGRFTVERPATPHPVGIICQVLAAVIGAIWVVFVLAAAPFPHIAGHVGCATRAVAGRRVLAYRRRRADAQLARVALRLVEPIAPRIIALLASSRLCCPTRAASTALV